MKREALTTIYPETIARRNLPVNFNPEHLQLFEGEVERVIAESRFLKFSDVLASPEGVLFKGTRILPESFAFPYHLEEWRLRSVCKVLAMNYVFRRRGKVEREVLWVTDDGSAGHF